MAAMIAPKGSATIFAATPRIWLKTPQIAAFARRRGTASASLFTASRTEE
jgi:hypothetical protein